MRLSILHLTLFLLLMGLVSVVSAQMLSIHISPEEDLEKHTYQALGETVSLTTADSFPIMITTLKPLDQIHITNRGQLLEIKKGDKVLGKFPSLLFWCNDGDTRFNLN